MISRLLSSLSPRIRAPGVDSDENIAFISDHPLCCRTLNQLDRILHDSQAVAAVIMAG